MKLDLTPEQTAFIKHAIVSGRYLAPEEAINDAMELWLNRERARMEITASLDAAEADIAAGNYACYSAKELPGLADDLKHKARQRRDKI